MAIRSKKNANVYENNLTDDEAKEILAKIDSEMVGMDFSKIPELEILDPKLCSLLQKHICKEPPDHLKLKILKKIREEKNQTDKPSFFARLTAQVFQPIISPQYRLANGLVALFIIGIISGLSYLIYYQYQNNKNTNPGLIVEQQTPAINATPTPVPAITPSPEATPIPKVAENNSKKDKIDLGATNQNLPNLFIAKDRRQNKPGTRKQGLKSGKDLPNLNVQEEEQLVKNDFPSFSNPEESAVRSVTIKDIKAIYLEDLPTDFWSISFKTELETELAKYWKISKKAEEANVTFRVSEDKGIVLLHKVNNEIVWQRKNFIIGKGDAKIIAKEIVSDLVNLRNTEKQSQ